MYVTDEQRKELLTFLQNKNWDVEMEIEETATAMPVAEAAYVPPLCLSMLKVLLSVHCACVPLA